MRQDHKIKVALCCTMRGLVGGLGQKILQEVVTHSLATRKVRKRQNSALRRLGQPLISEDVGWFAIRKSRRADV